ncbi:MAG TPA: hypothetical protein VE077_22705 [Candidatus Methylomirabilis sp.]|nr:hypothetical protein [Candidatus Methylomirabilis sp.]
MQAFALCVRSRPCIRWSPRLTHDPDFAAIPAVTHGKKPSVVQFRATDISPEALVSQTIHALRHATSDLEAGALLSVEPERTRLRILPLRADE